VVQDKFQDLSNNNFHTVWDLLAALIRVAFQAHGASKGMDGADGGSKEFEALRELLVACPSANQSRCRLMQRALILQIRSAQGCVEPLTPLGAVHRETLHDPREQDGRVLMQRQQKA